LPLFRDIAGFKAKTKARHSKAKPKDKELGGKAKGNFFE